MPRRTHRHLVAVPLTLALLASVLAVRPTGGPSAAAAAGSFVLAPGQSASAGMFAMQPGITGVLDAGSSLRSDGVADATLSQGSVTVHADGYLRMSLGADMAVHGVRAGWFALRDAGGSLAVALSAPIIVTARGQSTVLTAGEQLRIPTDPAAAPQRSTVPQGWLHDHAAVLAGLPTAPAAVAGEGPLQILVAKLDDGDTAGAAAYVADPGNAAALASDAARPQLAAILARLGAADPDAGSIAVALDCARRLAGGIRGDVLLSLSYGIAGTVRGNGPAEQALTEAFPVGDDAAELAAFITGVDASTSMPLPDAFAGRWRLLTERAAATDAPAAGHLVALAAGLPGTWVERGFPVHARRWEEAVAAARGMVSPLLNADDRAVLDDAIAAAAEAELPKVAVQPASSSSSSAAPAPARPADELIAGARRAILDNGGMVSTTTSFVVPANEPDGVRVLGAIFPTHAGDASFDFTYHPARGTLDKIVLQGHLFPNALTFEQFMASL